MNTLPQIVMIGGPTAVGKTALAIHLAQTRPVRLINADAFQVYQGMDIGTAKPTAAEQAMAPHALIDILPPTASFTVAQFMKRAHAEIAQALTAGELPVLVGGTGFYLNALRLNLPLGEHGASASREKWSAFLAANGAEALHAILVSRDPVAAEQIPAGNTRRVIRALEVIETTGQLFSAQPAPEPRYDTFVIGLTTERAILYERINRRVDEMMALGLLAEVRQILDQTHPDAQALAAIGYKEFIPYFEGTQSLEAAVTAVKQNSRRYAKRQLTYFHNQMPAHWFDLVQHPEEMAAIDMSLDEWLRPSFKA